MKFSRSRLNCREFSLKHDELMIVMSSAVRFGNSSNIAVYKRHAQTEDNKALKNILNAAKYYHIEVNCCTYPNKHLAGIQIGQQNRFVCLIEISYVR